MPAYALNLWVNGPPTDQPGTVHGTVKKFKCASIAVEMPPEARTISAIPASESNPYWNINGKPIKMWTAHFDPQYVADYVLIQGCEPILDVGLESEVVAEGVEYNLLPKVGTTYTPVALASRPEDWYVCGDTKYYIKEDHVDGSGRIWNSWKPVGWTNQNNQYAPATFDSSTTYYLTNHPMAVDVYFNSAAHFGITSYATVVAFADAVDSFRYFGPKNYNQRASYPNLSGAMPGLWAAYWDYGGGFPGMYIRNSGISGTPIQRIIDGIYDYRYKYYAFTYNYTDTDVEEGETPEEKTYVGFLFTVENGLGVVVQANAMFMSQEVVGSVIKTPDGGVISGMEGGDGEWDDSSDSWGDGDGDTTDGIAGRENGVLTGISDGYQKYVWHYATGLTAPAFTEFMGRMFYPDTWDAWVNKSFNPLQAVITCHLLPTELAPAASGIEKKIEAAGMIMSSSNAPTFTDMLTTYHVGDIDLGPYTGSFADLENTEIFIHLPYIGEYRLDTKFLTSFNRDNPAKLSVDYFCDVWTGDCCAWIWVQDGSGSFREDGQNASNYKYEFKGNCAKPVRLAQVIPRSYFIKEAALTLATDSGIDEVTSRTSAARHAASDLIADAEMRGVDAFNFNRSKDKAGSMVNSYTNAVQRERQQRERELNRQDVADRMLASNLKSFNKSVMNASAQITTSNNSGGAANLPVWNECYLTIVRPVWSNPTGYGDLFGYPSDIGGTITMSSEGAPFEGFLSVRAVRLDGIEAEDAEKSEIEALMKSGIYCPKSE